MKKRTEVMRTSTGIEREREGKGKRRANRKEME